MLTAWLLAQKLRRSMIDPHREPLEGVVTLREATAAIGSSDARYIAFKAELAELTRRRDAIGTQMIRMIEDAEFGGIPIDEEAAGRLIQAAGELLESGR
jgi:hypothetical protein